jgi:hypothetical protein
MLANIKLKQKENTHRKMDKKTRKTEPSRNEEKHTERKSDWNKMQGEIQN